MVLLAEERIKRGKTQSEMASLLGIAISTYNMYENGQRKIPEEVATKICNILELKKDDIFLVANFTIRKNNK